MRRTKRVSTHGRHRAYDSHPPKQAVKRILSRPTGFLPLSAGLHPSCRLTAVYRPVMKLW